MCSGVELTPRSADGGKIEIVRRIRFKRDVIIDTWGGEIFIDANVFVRPIRHRSRSVSNTNMCKNIELRSLIIAVNSHEYRDSQSSLRFTATFAARIIVADDVWIGAGARILGAVNIGEGAVVGAGAVVSRDVPAFSVVAEIPAKVLAYREPVQTGAR